MIRKSNLIILSLLMFLILSCSQKKESDLKGKVIMFHAGSLTVPFQKMEEEFEKKHPSIDIMREASGSTKCARKITDLKKDCDIMASADYQVIDKYLMGNYSNWNIKFATNQLVLCYTDKSKNSDKVNSDNWYEILQQKGVEWGHSDPNLDPCGYRALMVLQLAEKYYQKKGLYDKLIANRPQKNVRPKSVQLVSLLQTGNMDYAWEYLSVAVQHNLKYIILPDQINLGNYKHDSFYKNAKVKVSGKKPGTFDTKTGNSCTYGITILKNAPNSKAAIEFVKYLLDPEGGLKILKEMGQPPFIPARVNNEEMLKSLPEELKKRVEVKI